MSTCPRCGKNVVPNTRFCTECGQPLAAAPGAAGFAPPPAPGAAGFAPPPAPGAAGFAPPPAPGAAGFAPPAAPGAPGFAPPPAPPSPQAQVAAAAAPAPPAVATDRIRMATSGDLYNSGQPIAVIVTEQRLVLMQNGGTAKVEEVPGIRHALAGDFDGDGTQELAMFSDSHVWLVRFGAAGSVASGKVALPTVPEHLAVAPFTNDGRSMLMSMAQEKITFYVLHPAKGLVEVSSASLPAFEP